MIGSFQFLTANGFLLWVWVLRVFLASSEKASPLLIHHSFSYSVKIQTVNYMKQIRAA